MEININTSLGSHKRDITNNAELVELIVEIHTKFKGQDNNWNDD